MSEKASIVLRGGHVQTMVAPDDIASAVAVCGNRIAYVGDDAGVEAYIGEGTKVIDLDGRFVCPGFMDGHLHVPGKWITTLYQIDLEGKSTNEEYVETIRSFVEAHPDVDPTHVCAACIGEKTRATAEGFGMKTFMSERATMDSLAAAIMREYAQKD